MSWKNRRVAGYVCCSGDARRAARWVLIVVSASIVGWSCGDGSEATSQDLSAALGDVTDILGSGDVDAAGVDTSVDVRTSSPENADRTWRVSPRSYVEIARFEGSYDSDLNRLEIETVTVPGRTSGSEYVGLEQALWCPSPTTARDTVRIYSTEDPVSSFPGDPVPEACVGPLVNSAPFPVFGVRCGNVRIEVGAGAEQLYDMHAEIFEFTGSDQQVGYRYPLGTGAPQPNEDYPLSQQYGLWSYGDIGPSEHSDVLWTFRNADLADTPYRFSGRVVSAVQECTEDRGPNGIDDDCDGVIDNGCGIFPGDAPCVVDEDCESGECIETLDGRVCTYLCPEGVFGTTCDQSCPGGAANPCSGQGVCDDGAAGTGVCVCDAGYAESDCSATCPGGPTCSGGGICDVSAVPPTCICDPLLGTHGEACAYTCDDSVQNGTETGVDCGGPSCGPCGDGGGCVLATDCVSGVCTDGTCQAPSCADGVLNGAETDVDCGGPACAPCDTDGGCSVDGDCLSGICADEVCLAPSCDDGVLNGAETDVDCGGAECPGCDTDDLCDTGNDCASGVCDAGVCVAPTCDDSVQNGTETGVDCGGGACPPCGGGQGCDDASDCASGVCVDGLCQHPTCDDGVLNGAETDVDCGGADCPACDDDQACDVASDCMSGVCTDGTCAVPTCDDGVMNGDETDVDCGGAVCPSCGEGGTCLVASDCGELAFGAWGACEGFDGICGEAGTRSRTRSEPTCTQTGCTTVVTTETEACTRTTAGETCDESEIGAWSACGGFASDCATQGTRTREVTIYTCDAGGCVASTSTETESCTRVTDGDGCGETTIGAWSACGGFDGVCGTTGTRTRVITTFTCGDGVCETLASTESESCTRTTAGDVCAATETTAWSACGGFDGACGEIGTRSRDVTTYSCVAGACDASTAQESESCTRDTAGASCGEVTYGPWSECEGLGGVCDSIGERTRSVATPLCGAGLCNTIDSTETETCTVGDPAELPTITSQPTDQTTCPTAATTFSVSATGTDLSYQWQVSSNGGVIWAPLSDGVIHSGVTTPTLTVTPSFDMSGYSYQVVVSGTCGIVTSEARTLTVATAPTGVSASASPNPICAGASLSLSGSATGATSWSWSGPSGFTATTQNASRSGIVASHAGTYTVTATNTCGSTQASTASVTVNPTTAITSQPANRTVCAGTATTFAVSASGTGLGYQWQVSTNGGSSWTNISNGGAYGGATTSTLSVTPTTGMNDYRYRAVVSGTCGNVTSTARTLTVNTAPTGVSASASPNPICAGASLSLSGSATGATSWSWSGPSGFTATTQNASRAGMTASHAGTYTVTATNTCGSTPASTASVTVNASTAITSQPANRTVCAGTATTFAVSASGTGLGFQWQVSTNGGSSWTNISNGGAYSGATTSTLSVTPTTGMNDYRYRAVVSGTCGNVTSTARTLTVNSAATITSQPTHSTVCAGTGTSFSVSATGTGLSYQWQVSTNGGSSWTNISNGGAYSGATTSTLSVTPTTGMNDYRYRAVVSGTCGNVTSTARTLTVNSAATITSQPANSTTCAGTSTSFTVAATGAGLSYQWQLSTNGGSTWSNISNGGAYSGATTASLSVAATSGLNSYRYRAIVSGTCGNVTSTARTLTVTNTPTGVSASAGPNPICAGATLNLAGSGTNVTSWSWTGPSGYAASIQNPSRTNVTTSHAGTYNLAASNTCGATSASTASVTVHANGAPCGTTVYGPWSACGGFSGTCGNTGTRTRSVTTSTCSGGSCVTSTTTETGSCTRNTNGTTCADISYGAWSACGGFSGTCGNAGTRTRSVSTYACSSGSCVATTTTETEACTRNTNGTSCGTTQYGSWGACGGFSGTCGNSGTQSRTVTTYTCSGGSCSASTTTQTQGCTRNTNGTSCGTTQYGSWGACGGFSGTCGNSGTQSRTVTTYTCSGGSCSASTTTQTQSCTRNTNGTSCGTTQFGSWGACGGFSGTCGNSGTQSRTVTTYTCSGGSCSASTTTQTQSCTRNTNGTSCGTTQFGSWGACGGFSGTCGNSGTQSRTVTTYTCSGGSCSASTTTQTQGCTRNTNGTSCGTTQVGSWGACGGFSGTCGNSGTQSRTVTTYTCSGGSCSASTTTQTQGCTRNTNGTSCGTTTFEVTGVCGPLFGEFDDCWLDGQQPTTTTTYTCGSGTCNANQTHGSMPCSRDTACGQTCTGWQGGAIYLGTCGPPQNPGCWQWSIC